MKKPRAGLLQETVRRAGSSFFARKSDTEKSSPQSVRPRDCLLLLRVRNYFLLSATATATATVAPTMGLLPIPRKPIISTWAGTEEEPAN